MNPTKFYEVRLPEGDVMGFDIGRRWDNGDRRYDPTTWLSQGYVGVRFIGAGKGKTHLRPTPGVWTTVGIDQHPGIVRFESMTIHGQGRAAVQAGRDNKAGVVRKFRIEAQDFELVAAEQSEAYGRVGWGFFTYQANVDFRDGDIWWGPAREHPFYAHAYAGPLGGNYERLRFHTCAAECIKGRFDPTETLWAGPKVKLVVRGCQFKDWYRPWSSRGGGVVLQGVGTQYVLIEKNEFWAPQDASHTRCVMVDDNPGNLFYSQADGKVGQGFANGDIVISRNLFRAGPGTVNLSPVIRVGNLAQGSHRIARSLSILNNAIYGQNLQVQVSNLPAGKLTIKGNNSPAIYEKATALGVDTTHEAQIPLRDCLVPVSAGYSA